MKASQAAFVLEETWLAGESSFTLPDGEVAQFELISLRILPMCWATPRDSTG